jgi:hypothetical protein
MNSIDNNFNVKSDKKPSEDISIFNLDSVKNRLNKNKDYLKCVLKETIYHFSVYLITLIILVVFLYSKTENKSAKFHLSIFFFSVMMIIIVSILRSIIYTITNTNIKNISMYLFSIIAGYLTFTIAFIGSNINESTAKKILYLAIAFLFGIILLISIVCLWVIKKDKTKEVITVSILTSLGLYLLLFILFFVYITLLIISIFIGNITPGFFALYYIMMTLSLVGSSFLLLGLILATSHKVVDKTRFRKECLDDAFTIENTVIQIFEDILYMVATYEKEKEY